MAQAIASLACERVGRLPLRIQDTPMMCAGRWRGGDYHGLRADRIAIVWLDRGELHERHFTRRGRLSEQSGSGNNEMSFHVTPICGVPN